MKKLLLIGLLVFNACNSIAQTDSVVTFRISGGMNGIGCAVYHSDGKCSWYDYDTIPKTPLTLDDSVFYLPFILGDAGIIEDTSHYCDCMGHLEKYRDKVEADEFLMQALLNEVYRLRKHTKRRHRYPPQ